jgi:hypothetical protein
MRRLRLIMFSKTAVYHKVSQMLIMYFDDPIPISDTFQFWYLIISIAYHLILYQKVSLKFVVKKWNSEY